MNITSTVGWLAIYCCKQSWSVSPTKTSKNESESLGTISLVNFIVLPKLLIRFKNIWWSLIPCFPMTRVSSTYPNHNEVFQSPLSLAICSKNPCSWKWYCSLAGLEMHCRIFCFCFSDVCGLFLYIFSFKPPYPSVRFPQIMRSPKNSCVIAWFKLLYLPQSHAVQTSINVRQLTTYEIRNWVLIQFSACTIWAVYIFSVVNKVELHSVMPIRIYFKAWLAWLFDRTV